MAFLQQQQTTGTPSDLNIVVATQTRKSCSTTSTAVWIRISKIRNGIPIISLVQSRVRSE
ncbi:hypothetical protein DAPPUDRAFT_236110 [Daphnia pulex]|uniref:Uncharacterized protein n=1 Tax=Daphnia pulex TaxID=6669 RepID=E9FZZ9_DAPPU|nr:hypothetical protein DAPPUDRAFT_236110 [Daphnia pulex]|eukprot:EFX87172.1 hypothetical protein DAPPUDRAFT_236110 [Daphnia pulex]